VIPGPDGSARLQRRIVEIDTLDDFDAIAGVTGAARMDGWRVRRVDLTGRADLLQEFDPAGALFLACDMTPDSLVYLEAGGALVFPDIPGAPVDEYRASLYTADELYGGVRDSGYQATLDAQIYAWSQQRTGDTTEIVVRALHDAGIDAALDVAVASSSEPVGGDGWARRPAGNRPPPRRDDARPQPQQPRVPRRHRRRARRDGGRQSRRLSGVSRR